MYAIKTRSGGVYLKMQPMGGACVRGGCRYGGSDLRG